MPIPVKIITNSRSNLDVKQINCSFPVKKSLNSGQKTDQYQTKFGY